MSLACVAAGTGTMTTEVAVEEEAAGMAIATTDMMTGAMVTDMMTAAMIGMMITVIRRDFETSIRLLVRVSCITVYQSSSSC